eukprot:CAMPEP_0204383998 /NCGR_PEP_ID=MMETSP0469-20131031/56492_1 /ASSEMBLY_ACC=CAM_ASM_000384 /TAXON_ID=2969 /ORGANISM="Oxyrrhis marina" /LENGTH=53 /DNA_ID=CAMNT_0051376499 /DNA_START=15 /DNA_END=173 /DNA_ORIENTATION=-
MVFVHDGESLRAELLLGLSHHKLHPPRGLRQTEAVEGRRAIPSVPGRPPSAAS